MGASPARTDATVVVVGGGFAGVACAKQLARHGVQVRLLDRHDYNQFQPLLYQVATAQVATTDVARPLRAMFPKRHPVQVSMALVTAVDPVAKTVTSADGITFTGDYLVLAMGTEPNFFNTPGAKENAFPLYSVDDAERLRSRLLTVFEDAHRNSSLIDRGAMNFVIVGAGATGVETAGALADAIDHLIPARVRDARLRRAEIHLVDPAPVVLAPFSEHAHAYAQRVLEQRGVKLELGVKVDEVGPDRVKLSDGREILTRTVVWAGGIKAAELAARSGLPRRTAADSRSAPTSRCRRSRACTPSATWPTHWRPTARRSRSWDRWPCRRDAARLTTSSPTSMGSPARPSTTATRASWR